MIRNKDVARAFVEKRPKHEGNASTYGLNYHLFGNIIATWHKEDVIFFWCDHYTTTTARHMNFILEALGSERTGVIRSGQKGRTTDLRGQRSREMNQRIEEIKATTAAYFETGVKPVVAHPRPIRTFYYASTKDNAADWLRRSRASTIEGAVRAAIMHVLRREAAHVDFYGEDGARLGWIKRQSKQEIMVFIIAQLNPYKE